MALSDTGIAKLIKAKDFKMHCDGNGLWLDLRSATSASWVLVYSYGGRHRLEIGIGSMAKMDCERAREERDWYHAGLMANPPQDPKEMKRLRKQAAARKLDERETLAIGALVKANVDKIAPKVTTDGQRKAWIASMQAAKIGRIADMLPGDVTREDCRQLLAPLYEGVKDGRGGWVREPTVVMADDIRQRLAATLAWAAEQNMITTPGWTNPCVWKDVDQNFNRKHHEEEHHAALAPDDVGGFVAQVRELQAERVPAIALEWIVLSACRLGEGCGARWDEIDLAKMTWTIPVERLKVKRRARGKKSPPHVVPLTDRHLELLAMVQPAEGEKADFLFRCYGRNAPVSTPGVRKVLNHLRVSADDVTCHGFRASFKTWAQAQQVTFDHPVEGKVEVPIYKEEWIERAICHIKGDPYGRGDFLPQRRKMMEAWATFCGIVQTPKVVELRPRRAA